ncbi:MAG: photosynthetic protein synthase [Rhodospirillales bacterium]|nr:photosynthetic protein synthase [Rhodospirillales bacterium]
MRRALLLLVLLGGCLVALLLFAAAPARAADERVDWSLRRTDGKPAAMRDLPQRWLLIYFGYTRCADVCPTALADLAEVMDQLGPLASRVQPIFVTLDPARDTPELLDRYVSLFRAQILPLTGSEASVAAAARSFHVHFTRYQDPKLGDYSIDHSSSFFLVRPDRHLVIDFATPDLSPDEIAPTLRALLNRHPVKGEKP